MLGNENKTLVRVENATQRYGSTEALSGASLDVRAGEIFGIVGHNGAGKSTLMRALTGLERLTSGRIEIDGQTQASGGGFYGVRMAYQEGSLAPELTVRENIYLSSAHWLPKWLWHSVVNFVTVTRLREIFPHHDISPWDYVDDLSMSARQKVEIARATIAEDLRVLILDEPTESLSANAIEHLYDYVHKLKAQGKAVIIVSHRLGEILSTCDRVAVMRDGAVVSVHKAIDLSERDLFLIMGGDLAAMTEQHEDSASTADDKAPVVARVPMLSMEGAIADIVAREGEVIGLAGIAGQGQEDVLYRLWRGKSSDVTAEAARAYVPGDRQKSGIFPLWSIAPNLSISALRGLASFGLQRSNKETDLVEKWVDTLHVRGGSDMRITGLSGGNQQKVIVARAFASEASTILLDDPFRGVDLQTKRELYNLIREEAAKGRTIIWYSSDNSEMQHCDRVYVLRRGRVAGELHGSDISADRIIAMSYNATGGQAA